MRKIIYFSALLAVVFIWPLSSQAQNGFDKEGDVAVRRTFELYGGYEEDLAIAPDGVLYAGLNSPNGLAVSTDGGESWIMPTDGYDFGTVGEVEVSTETNNAFILGGLVLYRSEDQGITWEALAGSSNDWQGNNYGSAMLYAHGKLLVARRDGTVDITDDEGETFTNVEIASGISSIWSLAASPTDDVFYAIVTIGETNYLYQSTDGGATWIDTGVSGNYTEVEVKPTDENFIILRGTDGLLYTTTGVSGAWSTMDIEEVNDVAFDGDRIYVGKKYTDDNGVSWGDLQEEAISFDSILKGNHVTINPNDADILYITSGRSIAKTIDGGQTFTDMYEGMLGITVNAITQSADKNIVWLAAQGGLAKTENFQDDTPTWEFPILPSTAVDFAHAVWLDPDDSDIVVVGAGSAIYRSKDGGDTWEMTTDEGLDGIVTTIVADEDEVLYAGTKEDGGGGGVWTSEDNGQTWTTLNAPDVAVNVLAVTSQGTILAGVGKEFITDPTTRGIYSFDGFSWTQLEREIEGYLINDILVVDEIIYVAGGETDQGSVFRSDDNGETWEDLTANGLPDDGWYHALTYEVDNPDVVYVSTARPAGTGHIYKSTDGGDSWYEFYTGLKDETFNAMLFDGLVSGTNTGLYAFQSKVKVNLKANKSKVAKGQTVKLTAVLKDAATKKALKGKTLKLYQRAKKSDQWQLVSRAKTNKNGKVVFSVQLKKKTFYQVRWTPKKDADIASYAASKKKSKTVKITIK